MDSAENPKPIAPIVMQHTTRGRRGGSPGNRKGPGLAASGTFLAETRGFEPLNGLPRYHLSRVAH